MQPSKAHNPRSNSESKSELQLPAPSEVIKQPIRHKGLYMKWEMVNGKLISRWFRNPD